MSKKAIKIFVFQILLGFSPIFAALILVLYHTTIGDPSQAEGAGWVGLLWPVTLIMAAKSPIPEAAASKVDGRVLAAIHIGILLVILSFIL